MCMPSLVELLHDDCTLHDNHMSYIPGLRELTVLMFAVHHCPPRYAKLVVAIAFTMVCRAIREQCKAVGERYMGERWMGGGGRWMVARASASPSVCVVDIYVLTIWCC